MTHHPIPQLDKKGLREFGLILGSIFAILFGIILPLLHRHTPPPWPWVIAVILWTLAILSPPTLNPIYQIWVRIGLTTGKIITPLWMGLVFYLVVMPMGFIVRLVGQDPMRRELNNHLETYRIPSQPRPTSSMERPF